MAMIKQGRLGLARSAAVILLAMGLWPLPLAGQQLKLEAQQNQFGKKFANQLVALTVFSALPGISGSRFNVKRPDPNPNYRINKLSTHGGFEGRELREDVKLYFEGGGGYLETDEHSFGLRDLPDDQVLIQTDRQVLSGQGGIGVSVQLTPNLAMRPVLQAAISHFSNETGLGSPPKEGFGLDPEDLIYFDWELWAATFAGSLQLAYREDVDAGRVELDLSYTQAYTEIVDAPSSLLKVSGTNGVFNLTGKFRQPTGINFKGRDLSWNVFSGLTYLTGNGRTALGFDHFLTFGIGTVLDVSGDELPLAEGLRLQLAVVTGKNLSGGQISVGFRF